MWPLSGEKKTEYMPVDEGDRESNTFETPSHPFHRKERNRSKRSRALQIIPWVTTVLFALSTLTLAIERRQIQSLGSYATGWATDFVSVRSEIEVQQVIFNGSPAIDENKTLYVLNPDPVKYVGPPSAEIDDNWDRLTWGRYILITKEEAHDAWGNDIEAYWDDQRGGYVAGLDMFHTLHCLGNLRKALHPEYYGDGKMDQNHDLHQDHCIEQLRQFVMCSGDMTPIPTKYYPAIGRNYVDSDRAHTCRNFGKLQRWMVDRYKGPTAIEPSFHS